LEDILQKKLEVKIDLVAGLDEIKIDMDGSENSFYARLDEIQLNPKIVNLHNIEIKKNSVKMDFKAPIICNFNNVDPSKSMMVGVKFKGIDKDAFVQKIEETARSFGPEWEDAVTRRKEAIRGRNQDNR